MKLPNCSRLPTIRNFSNSTDVLEEYVQNFAIFSGGLLEERWKKAIWPADFCNISLVDYFLDCSLRYIKFCHYRILAYNIGFAELLYGREKWFEDFIQHVNLLIEICDADVAADHDFR